MEKRTEEEINQFIDEKYSRYDEEAKERIKKFLLASNTKQTTYNTTPEQNEKIAKAIDRCPCCKSRSRFAQDYLNISSYSLYRKLKGMRKFTVNEIKAIESHFNIKVEETIEE